MIQKEAINKIIRSFVSSSFLIKRKHKELDHMSNNFLKVPLEKNHMKHYMKTLNASSEETICVAFFYMKFTSDL